MLDKLINDKKVLKIIRFGSQVYGTATVDSDTDYIVITEDGIDPKEESCNNADFHFYPISYWNILCQFNNIRCVEASFCGEEHYLKGEREDIDIDYSKIRSGFSSIASNSFVKCTKKLIIEKDYNPYIAKKSLFHSLRIIMFGIQIMKFGSITDFSEANKYYYDIMSMENNWELLKKKYQPIYNMLKTEFRYEHLKRMGSSKVK